MTHQNQYIVTKRFKQKAICGDLNLPFGTKCFSKDNGLYCDKGLICSITSQNAYDFFTYNNDGSAQLRRTLIDTILHNLDRSTQTPESYDNKWDKVWNDSLCNKYKREDYDDYWLWNHDFYHASIQDLEYIKTLTNN